MPRVIGVRFERSGKVFYFDPGDLELGLMDRVVVETDSGPETATVAIAPEQMVYIEVKGPLKPVLRKASEEGTQGNPPPDLRRVLLTGRHVTGPKRLYSRLRKSRIPQ